MCSTILLSVDKLLTQECQSLDGTGMIPLLNHRGQPHMRSAHPIPGVALQSGLPISLTKTTAQQKCLRPSESRYEFAETGVYTLSFWPSVQRLCEPTEGAQWQHRGTEEGHSSGREQELRACSGSLTVGFARLQQTD